MKPDITVVCSYYKNADYLLPCLYAWWANNDDISFELVIVDDGSDENVPNRIFDMFPFRITYVWSPHRNFGLSRMLNTGIRVGRADWLLLTEVGCLPVPGILKAHWEAREETVLSLGTKDYIESDPINALIPGAFSSQATLKRLRADHLIRSGSTPDHDPEKYGGEANFANAFFHRSGWEKLNGIDERYDEYGQNDNEFGWRWLHQIGHLKYVKDAAVMHIGFGRRTLQHPKCAALFGELRGQAITEDLVGE